MSHLGFMRVGSRRAGMTFAQCQAISADLTSGKCPVIMGEELPVRHLDILKREFNLDVEVKAIIALEPRMPFEIVYNEMCEPIATIPVEQKERVQGYRLSLAPIDFSFHPHEDF